MSIRILSLGAGVQSTAVLMLILEGRLQADAAIFADTGWEPPSVYQHLDDLQKRCDAAGFPLHIVTAGNIRSNDGAHDLPYYLANPDGSGGMNRRQCTANFKIQPIRRKLRSIMLEAGHKTALQLFGISADEVQRVRTSDRKYITNEYPLIDMWWRRSDCINYLTTLGMSAPRSACIGCPYHSDSEWRRLRDHEPAAFADAVAFERQVQERGIGLRATPYLHRQRVPLDQVDLSTPEDHGQLTFNDECEGMCGV